MINITVTGDTAEEVLAQLRALAGVASVVTGDAKIALSSDTLGAIEEVRTGQTTRYETTEALMDDLNDKPVAEKPKATRKPKGNVAPDAADTGSTTEAAAAVAETPTEAETGSDVAETKELVFDTDVAPVVLGAVQKHGKPTVESVLEEFGVERASQMEAARWPELIERLGDL